MPPPLPLRSDFEANQVRRLATQCRDAKQSRRLLSIAAVYDGMDRGSAAKIGGMDRQTLRDWVIRFNKLGAAGLVDIKSEGSRRRLNDEQMKELAILVEAGPDLEVHGVVRWRCRDLVDVIEKQFGVTYKERAVGYLLKALNFSHISGRPKHPAQNARVIDGFKKTSPSRSQPT